MKDTVKRALASPFLRHNTAAFIGSVAVATLNYLYYPVLGRLMRPADFGEVQAITSLFLQAVVFMSVFSVVIVNIVSKESGAEQKRRLLAELEKVALIITVVVVAALVALSAGLADFFHFGSIYPLLLILLALGLGVPATFRTAYLQGRRDFVAVAKIGAVSAGSKVVFSAILVFVGARAFGAVLGMVLAQGLALAYLVYLVRRRGWLRPKDFRRASLPDLRLVFPELRYAALVLVTTLSFNLFLSLDILAVKHWFSPTTAGLYGGIETLGRIVFFINISVAGVLLPSVSAATDPRQNRRLLLRSAALTTVLGLGVLAAFVLAPRQLVSLLMGSKFLMYAALLPRLGLFTFLASIINLLVIYYLAQRRLFIAPAMAAGVVAALALLYWRHATPAAVVSSLVGGALFTVAFIGAFRLLELLQFKPAKTAPEL